MENTQDLPEATAAAPSPSPKTGSAVDALFDALTSGAARGLLAAKKALEASARWLDARAKLAGELATKLSSPESPEQPSA